MWANIPGRPTLMLVVEGSLSGGEMSRLDLVLRALEKLDRMDVDPWSGRMFTHVYDPGDPGVHRVIMRAIELFKDKTMLDFTVYPSVLFLERELVGFYAGMFNLPEGGTGSFTYGGTESIILAVLAAREAWRRSGGTGRPRLVMPVTGHPAFAKAGYLLGLEVVRVEVDRETMEVEPGAIAEAIDRDTAMVAVSAVNYPFGSLDPVEEIAEEAGETWLHVDACIGGPVLAFAGEAGEEVPPFDFRVPRVRSLSVDAHKYGYSLKGGSIILFRDREDKKPTVFVDAGWPGYPLVNTAVLSTRSAAPLAAAWAVARYLGMEGYRRLAHRVVRARRKIQEGLEQAGLQVIGRPRAGILAFTSASHDILELARRLHMAGWVVQVQPGNRSLGFPPSIHLTVSPVHESVADEFLAAVEEALRGVPAPELRWEKVLQEKGLAAIEGLLAELRGGGLSGEALRAVNELIHLLDPRLAEELIREAILELFAPTRVDW